MASDVKLAVGPCASRCDKPMVVSNLRRCLLFHALDRNEINKITQAHRVAKTGRPAAAAACLQEDRAEHSSRGKNVVGATSCEGNSVRTY